MNDVQADLEQAELEASSAESSSALVLDEKEALRQSIERSEAELLDAVEELTAAVKNDVTLGAYIVDRPVAWLAGGFVVGMAVAWRR